MLPTVKKQFSKVFDTALALSTTKNFSHTIYILYIQIINDPFQIGHYYPLVRKSNTLFFLQEQFYSFIEAQIWGEIPNESLDQEKACTFEPHLLVLIEFTE